jgi:DNA-binding transcriptional regulator YiaG
MSNSKLGGKRMPDIVDKDIIKRIEAIKDNLVWEYRDLKESRKQLGFTQKQLAPWLGVSLKTIKNWEQGISKPSRAAMMLLELL